MKRGIFGGSFNPPHNFHLDIANYLIDNNILDEVVFVPTGNKYNKNGLIDVNMRFEMLKLVTLDNDKLAVSNYEIGDSLICTYQTLDYFNKSGEEIYFICGTDNLMEFDTWDNYEYILKNYRLLVVRRNNDDVEYLLNRYNNYKNRIVVIDIESNDISSTMIRDLIKNNVDVSSYIDSKVLEYINDKKLYKW